MAYAPGTGGIATPIGIVSVTAEGPELTRVAIGEPAGAPGSAIVKAALDQLAAWFAGERTGFDLPLRRPQSARGIALRQAICAIGYGKTATYGALAQAHASSARAIGQACARNPFPLIVPCHRVLGAGDALGFYSAGSGADTKRWLLDFERGAPRLL